MSIERPAYYRLRTRIIEQLYNELPNDDTKNNAHVLLRNGVIADSINDSYLHLLNIELPKINQTNPANDQPLTFEELCSYNTWFEMHPEKVAGHEIITTSLQFPISIKGSKEDILKIFEFLDEKNDTDITLWRLKEVEKWQKWIPENEIVKSNTTGKYYAVNPYGNPTTSYVTKKLALQMLNDLKTSMITFIKNGNYDWAYQDIDKTKRIRIARVKAAAKLKLLKLAAI
ncbi:MAG: hypothetical protein EOM76_11110 [Sphingobacteriia bacterium]|nr:hypothetical protein [Sphingobacteriia bacterium]